MRSFLRKKIILNFLLAIFLISYLPLPASAGINSANGFYLGGNVVLAVYDPPKGSEFANSLIPIRINIRPHIGLRINDFFAIESGYHHLVSESNDGGQIVTDFAGNQQKTGSDHYKLYAIDVAAKAIYPFCSGFSLYGKAGVAYVHQDVFNQVYESLAPLIDSKENKLRPIIGAGVSYNFTQHFSSDLSYNYIPGDAPIGNIKMVGIGLTYVF